MVTGESLNATDTFTIKATTELNQDEYKDNALASNDLCENATAITTDTGKFTALLGYIPKPSTI